MTDGRPRVLLSFTAVNDSTNPYVTQLLDALRPRASVQLFSWPRAFLGRYDVLHVHWPERLVRGTTAMRSAVRALLFIALLTVTRLRRVPIVRTLHNDSPHEHGSRLENLALDMVPRRTTLWIMLNDATTAPTGAPVVVVPHGHYLDVLAPAGDVRRVPGRMLFFGLVRRYKGIEELLAAFRELRASEPHASLHVVGRVVDADTAAAVRTAASDEPAITTRLEHVPDHELAVELAAGQLVVLPYRRMNNSGALLLALSAGRPVLVPDNAVTRSLADEVGHDWVHRFAEPLDAGDLAAALARTAEPPDGVPDLRARDWASAADAHVQAYRDAIARVRGRRA